MASGDANRTNRPNTWLHRPATRRDDFPCQPGAVHTWHIFDIQGLRCPVRREFEAPQPRSRALSSLVAAALAKS